MHEDIIAFSDTSINLPFRIAMSGISYCDGSYIITRRKSPIWCMEYVLKGRGYVNCGNQSFYAEQGDIYILSKGLDHYYYSDTAEPWTKIWFNIDGTLVESIIKSYGLYDTYHLSGLDLSELFYEFLDTARTNGDAQNIFDSCAQIFLKITQKIAEYVHSANKNDEPTSAQLLKREIDELTDYTLAYSKLFDKIYCTQSHAIRTFKEEYGITPYRYLIDKKLRVAEMMLSSTGMSIKEISEFLGFNDSHYFSAFFKKYTNISPSTYRKKQLSIPPMG